MNTLSYVYESIELITNLNETDLTGEAYVRKFLRDSLTLAERYYRGHEALAEPYEIIRRGLEDGTTEGMYDAMDELRTRVIAELPEEYRAMASNWSRNTILSELGVNSPIRYLAFRNEEGELVIDKL